MTQDNRETVLIAPTTDGQAGLVQVIWTDPDETPLEAIGRLNQEVLALAAERDH